MAVVENMSYFDGDDGKRYYPFGCGSGDRIVRDFGLPNLVRFPIVAGLSAAGDGVTYLRYPQTMKSNLFAASRAVAFSFSFKFI